MTCWNPRLNRHRSRSTRFWSLQSLSKVQGTSKIKISKEPNFLTSYFLLFTSTQFFTSPVQIFERVNNFMSINETLSVSIYLIGRYLVGHILSDLRRSALNTIIISVHLMSNSTHSLDSGLLGSISLVRFKVYPNNFDKVAWITWKPCYSVNFITPSISV